MGWFLPEMEPSAPTFPTDGRSNDQAPSWPAAAQTPAANARAWQGPPAAGRAEQAFPLEPTSTPCAALWRFVE